MADRVAIGGLRMNHLRVERIADDAEAIALAGVIDDRMRLLFCRIQASSTSVAGAHSRREVEHQRAIAALRCCR